MSTDQLSSLERRVTTRYLDALNARLPADPFDTSAWLTTSARRDHLGTYEHTPEFPRERWAVQPVRRTLALLLCDRLLDLADTHQLTDEGWTQLGFLWLHGGKVRLS